ncbi:hypothetical protein QQ020_21295 [Fulvivirgaceae bacterium BMA12]|uniref:Uncharacterized protein n=1 Tax=Agaribacillus aureus TaxID=3051825 RepID=A0ABT8LA45_9BACT|nr:hypothetical protein [Fulvivirgaceae bacterium BMA12]
MIRLLFFAAIIVALYFIIKKLLAPGDFVRCGRCEGKGFWYAARDRVTCDWCKGSGKLPREGIE